MAQKKLVAVTRPIPDAGLALLREVCEIRQWEDELPPSPEELDALLDGVDGALTLVTDRIDGDLLDRHPTLRVVSNFAVGYDNVDVDAATARGVAVCNTPGVLTEATAELAFSLLMATARRIPEAVDYVRDGHWRTWGPLLLLGRDITNATIGIVGFGRIGQAVARRARGFGMRVVYTDAVQLPPEVEAETGAERFELADLLAQADFVSIHTNLTPETRHLFGAEAFEAMKPTAVVVNTSRGPVIDEAALADALEAGEIFGAGLDVFEREPEVEARLLKLENAVVIPHLGSATVDTRNAMGELVVDNVFAAIDGTRPPTLLNPDAFPG
jgi:glyoxylate reductase